MTGHTTPSSDGLLAGVFRGYPQSRKANVKRSVHSFRDRFIIILIISDTRGKWTLARNPDRIWWHCHTSLKLFLAAALCTMDNRSITRKPKYKILLPYDNDVFTRHFRKEILNCTGILIRKVWWFACNTAGFAFDSSGWFFVEVLIETIIGFYVKRGFHHHCLGFITFDPDI